MAAATSKTAPSGAVVPPPVRNLAAIADQVRSVRTCPLAEVDSRVMLLALRLANAESLVWEMRNAVPRP